MESGLGRLRTCWREHCRRITVCVCVCVCVWRVCGGCVCVCVWRVCVCVCAEGRGKCVSVCVCIYACVCVGGIASKVNMTKTFFSS